MGPRGNRPPFHFILELNPGNKNKELIAFQVRVIGLQELVRTGSRPTTPHPSTSRTMLRFTRLAAAARPLGLSLARAEPRGRSPAGPGRMGALLLLLFGPRPSSRAHRVRRRPIPHRSHSEICHGDGAPRRREGKAHAEPGGASPGEETRHREHRPERRARAARERILFFGTGTDGLLCQRHDLGRNGTISGQTFYSRTVVQQVNLTTSDGDMGILADHVPIVEQLVPGVVEVVFDAGKSEKLFGWLPCSRRVRRQLTLLSEIVSGGFLAVNPDSTCNITAVEAVPLDQIDFEVR